MSPETNDIAIAARTNNDQASTTDAGKVTSWIRRGSLTGAWIVGGVSNWIGGTTTSGSATGKGGGIVIGPEVAATDSDENTNPPSGADAGGSGFSAGGRKLSGAKEGGNWNGSRPGGRRRRVRQVFEEFGLDPQVLRRNEASSGGIMAAISSR